MLQILVVMLALLQVMDAKEYMENCDGDHCERPIVAGVEDNHYFTVRDICPILGRYCIDRYVQAGVCITQLNSSNFTVAGLCPYFSEKLLWSKYPLSNYYLFPEKLPLTELTSFTCGAYNREGCLCSKCKSGYGPAVYAFSLMCAKCSSSSVAGWALYLFLVLFPITVFYIFVIIFNIRATAPPFTAFVLMCQTYCMIDLMYVPLKMKLTQVKSLTILWQTVRLFCGFWNLDFFRYIVPPFCVSSHLSNIQAVSLEYIHVVYPLVLILITFICIELHARNVKVLVLMWKPFHRCVTHLRRTWDPRASIINAFSTFLLLNLSKLIFIMRYSLYTTRLHVVDSTLPTVLYYRSLYSEPTVHRCSKQHLPYLLCSTTFLVVFFLFPTFLLCLYPTKVFRRLLQCCLTLRCQWAMSAFIDTFQGHYKDGTNGTRDYRAASGIHLVVLFLMTCTGIAFESRLHMTDIAQPTLMTVSLFYALARPCTQKYANIIQSLLHVLTALVMLIISYTKVTDHYHMLYFLVMFLCLLTPHVALGSFVIYRVTKRIGVDYHCLGNIFCKHVPVKVHACCGRNYPQLNDLYPNECSPLLSGV